MTHKSINTFIWKVNADIFYVMLPLLIIAWGKNPNKLTYLKLIAHVIGDSRHSLWEGYSIVTSEGDTIDARATFQNKTWQLKLLCVSACCISNVVWFIYGLLVKNFECLLLNLMKLETLSTCSFLFTLMVRQRCLDDDHSENCDVSNKDRLAHDSGLWNAPLNWNLISNAQ